MKSGQKIYGAGIALLLVAAVFVCMEGWQGKQAAKTQEAQNNEVISLRLWYPWTGEDKGYKKYFLEAVEEYNQSHQNVSVSAEGIERELYREQLPTAIASNDTPDIYFCSADGYLRNIVRSGKLLRIDPYMSEETGVKIKQESLQNMRYEGGLYGLGFAENYGVFLVNKELFERYGCEVPKSWGQLLEVCEIFRNHGVTPFACSTESDTGYRLYLEMICLSKAGRNRCEEIINGNGSDTALFLEGVEAFENLCAMGALGDRSRERSLQEVEEAFYFSRIPMYVTKSEFVGGIVQENSPLFGKVEIAPFPGDSKARAAVGGVSDCFVINEGTKYPQEAVSALEEILFLFSIKLYESGAGIPTWDMNGKKRPDVTILNQLYELDRQSDSSMQYWEYMIGGTRAESFTRSSADLFYGNITAEEFVESLKGILSEQE